MRRIDWDPLRVKNRSYHFLRIVYLDTWPANLWYLNWIFGTCFFPYKYKGRLLNLLYRYIRRGEKAKYIMATVTIIWRKMKIDFIAINKKLKLSLIYLQSFNEFSSPEIQKLPFFTKPKLTKLKYIRVFSKINV